MATAKGLRLEAGDVVRFGRQIVTGVEYKETVLANSEHYGKFPIIVLIPEEGALARVIETDYSMNKLNKFAIGKGLRLELLEEDT